MCDTVATCRAAWSLLLVEGREAIKDARHAEATTDN